MNSSFRPKKSAQSGQAKYASVRMPNNTDMWTDKIYKHIGRSHPYLAKYLQGDIDWSIDPIDNERGEGTGFITALLGKQPIRIPVIVRDWELKPVDIYVSEEGRMDLIDKEIVMEHMAPSSVELGQKVNPDRQTQREEVRGMLGKVGGYSSFADDLERAMDHLVEDFPGLEKSAERLKERAVSQESDPYDTLLVEEAGSGGYKIAAFRKGHKVDSLFVEKSTAFEDPKSKLASAARKAGSEGGVILIERELDKTAYAASSESGAGGRLSSGDAAKLASADGSLIRGVLLPKRFFGESPAPGSAENVFVSSGGHTEKTASLQESPSGDVPPLQEDVVSASEAQAGDYGFFATFGEGEKTASVYGPVRISQQYVNASGESTIKATSEDEGQLELVLSKFAQRVAPAGEDQKYVVPNSFSFFQTEGEIEGARSAESILAEKTASQGLGVVELSEESGLVKAAASGGLQHDSLSVTEAKAFLMSLGLPSESADGCVKEARDLPAGKTATFYGLDRPVREDRGQEKLSSAERRKVERLLDEWTRRRQDVNKLASQMDMNPSAQDELSTMNAFNQYNATRFAEATDEIEEAKGVVADLLFQARKGDVDTIDENVAKDGLTALDSLAKGLYDLNAASEGGA